MQVDPPSGVAQESATVAMAAAPAESGASVKNPSPLSSKSSSLAPSHWVSDGHAVILPSPSSLVRRKWVERSIVQHGLLKSWTSNATPSKQEQDEPSKTDDEAASTTTANAATTPQIHPLALASSRFQNEGINELNRSINLVNLVKTGEYFSMTNIVADAALELAAAAAATSTNSHKQKEETTIEDGNTSTEQKSTPTNENTSNTAKATTTTQTTSPQDSPEFQKSQYYQALYILKRKQGQFQAAAQVLKRHRERLKRGLLADQKPLLRLAALRHRWRLCAPEHGQRARPHPVRPTEVLAADVDLVSENASGTSTNAGRLARRIPRYGTIELRETPIPIQNGNNDTKQQDDPMEIEESNHQENDVTSESVKTESVFDDGNNQDESGDCWTFAEPFALADPTLGKLDADFDPSKIEMLTLQFALEDVTTTASDTTQGLSPNTGETVVSACLEPTRSLQTNAALPDENVLMELQHSLLCSKLFESMRRELADDTDEIGQIRTTSQQLYENVVWLAATSGMVALPQQAAGLPHLRGLQVVHVHEGEVCVQLNARYTLRVQLVPSSTTRKTLDNPPTTMNDPSDPSSSAGTTKEELLLLCKTLLWKAHSLYHEHFVAQQAKYEEEQAKAKQDGSNTASGHLVKPVASLVAAAKESPHVLQGCVDLGTKLLMERQIRKCFKELQQWLHESQQCTSQTYQQNSHSELTLQISALSTSVLEAATHWTLTVGDDLWVADVVLEGGPRLQLFWWADIDDYRKVDFESIGPFCLFLQRQLRKLLREKRNSC